MSFFERWTKMKVAEGEKSSGGVATSDKSRTPELRLADGEILFTDEHEGLLSVSEDMTAPFPMKQGEEEVALERKSESVPGEPKLETVQASVPSEEDSLTPTQPKKQKKSVQKPVQPKGETGLIVAAPERKEEFLKKGDIFENTETGETLFVEGKETRQDMPGILYTEAYLGGTLKNEGKVMWRPAEGFRVLIRGKEMKKNDPIKKQYPDFYVKYEEQMTKADNAFAREFEANRVMIRAWGEFIDEEYGVGFLKEGKVSEKKEEGEEMLKYLRSIQKKIEKIAGKWNKLDDRIVEQGRQALTLLAELRALDTSLPDYALEMKASELKLWEEKQEVDEPNVELVERGYQEILLERKKEVIEERYNKVVDSNIVVAQDMPILNDFLKQINKLYLSINEKSSSKDIRKTIDEISIVEKQMFARKNKNNDEQNEIVGGFVRNKKGNQREVGNGNGHGKKGNIGNQRVTRPQGGTGTNEEESLALSGAILQAEQGGGSISQEQRQTAFDTKKKIDELIREKKLLAKGIFEDPENIGKISKGKYKLHIGFLDDLGDSAKKPFRNINISELQAILEKVKGVEFRVEEFVAPKKVIETPVTSVSEKPKERTYEDLYKTLGQNSAEISFRESFLNDALSAGLQHVRKEMEFGDDDMKKFVGENKEDLTEYFSQGIIASFFDLPSWTLSEKELFARTFVGKYFENFVK